MCVVCLLGFGCRGELFCYLGFGGYCYTGVLFVLERTKVGAEERIWKVWGGKEYDQIYVMLKIDLIKYKESGIHLKYTRNSNFNLKIRNDLNFKQEQRSG